jgi:transcriptional regulator with XRE-family HTH domain
MSNTSDIPTKATAEHQPQDAAEIAFRVGVSADYVRRVLNGKRRNHKVERAYAALLKERAKAQREFQKGTEKCG